MTVHVICKYINCKQTVLFLSYIFLKVHFFLQCLAIEALGLFVKCDTDSESHRPNEKLCVVVLQCCAVSED